MTKSKEAILMLALFCPENGLNMTPTEIALFVINRLIDTEEKVLDLEEELSNVGCF